MMIKAIIFDYGGVLPQHTSLSKFGQLAASTYGVDPKAFKRTIWSNWDQAKVNAIPSHAFWDALAAFAGVDKAVIRRDMTSHFGFRPDVLAFIKTLKKRYKLGLLSNNIEDWLEESIENHKLASVFDVIVTSYGSKKAKPDPAIYAEAVEKLGVTPEACVFIDDKMTNVLAAQQAGMKGIQFKDLEQLKKELAAMSVAVD